MWVGGKPYIFVLIASASSLQGFGERETSAGSRSCQASGRSPVSGGIGRSTASAGEQNVDGVDEQLQGPGRISRSTASVSSGRSTVSANEQAGPRRWRQWSTASASDREVQGIDERSTRSVTTARVQQVRGVRKQVRVLSAGNKVGVHGVREQTTCVAVIRMGDEREKGGADLGREKSACRRRRLHAVLTGGTTQ